MPHTGIRYYLSPEWCSECTYYYVEVMRSHIVAISETRQTKARVVG